MLPALVPGDCRVTLYRLGDGTRVPCSRAVTVRVVADETAAVELASP